MALLTGKLSHILFLSLFFCLLFTGFLPAPTFAADNFSSWQNQTSLPHLLANHEAVIYDNTIYIFGGGGTGFYNEVRASKINSDDSLGQWELKSNLPTILMWHNVLLNGNRIYILGGVIESIPAGFPNSVDTVLTTTIDANGNLGSWQTLNAMPKKLAEGYSAIYNNKIFYVGGAVRTNGAYNRNANVYSATINGDGTISNWGTETSLPEGRDGFNLFLVNNRLIVIGGETNSSAANPKVLSATIDNTGHLSNWANLPDMISPMRRAVSFYDGKNIYLLGGYNGSSFLTSIYSAEIDNDNKPIQWTLNSHTLPSIICCSPGVFHNNTFYILGGHNGNGYLNTVISTAIVNPTTTLNVPDIKQYSAPWGDDEYDTASSWKPVPTNKTIDRWGCALTSAAMVLQYNGHSIDPDTLNTWLKDNNGYTRDGGIIWTAVSKYSKDHDTASSPSLEFAYHNVDDTNIITELETNKRPAIFKLANATSGATHFIVAKGKKTKVNPTDTQDYFVNDPDSSTNSKLSDSKTDFNMDLAKYGIFTKSHTDLSYIVLFVDPNVNLKVFDTNGNEITDGYLFEGPIIDGIDKTSLGGSHNGLNAFYYPKPVNGEYKVEISGNGNYQLDSYLYDVDGNVNVGHTPDSLTTNNKDVFLINFNHDTSSHSNTQDITFSLLLNRIDTDKTRALISNNGAYTSIKNMIENAQIQLQKGNILTSKQFLSSAVSKIQYYASIGAIDQTEALILVNYIQLLGQTY